MKSIFLLLGAACLAEAQIGYPGGGYPLPGQTPYPYPGGNRYPSPGGSPIPGTGRTPRGTPGTTNGPNQPLPNFRGKLKHMDAKSLSLELDDYRLLEFRITSKTKYFKGGDEVKSPQFNPGDQLSVEGPYDATGALTAVNVYWEKAASAGTSGEKKDDDPVDTWKDKPGDKDKPTTAKGGASADGDKTATETAPPPAPADPDDPGRPVLKRGKPAQRASTAPEETQSDAKPAPVQSAQAKTDPAPAQTAKPQSASAQPPKQVAANLPPNTVALPPSTVKAPPPSQPKGQPATRDAAPNLVNLPAATVSLPRPSPPEDTIVNSPPPEEPAVDQLPLGYRQEDPLIRRATEAALDFTETLPNYVTQEVVSRAESEGRPASWHAVDVVTTDVVYENGKEDYRNITINGKPATKNLEETGAWSTGEFGTVLIDLFSPATAADFHPRREERIAGINAKLYDFDVKRENSHWTLHFVSQTYVPAYHGSVWIDPKTARVLRIEMEALGLPQGFPTDHVESATDYQYVRLGGTQQYLLPVHSETLSCQRGSTICSKNSIDFRNYHK